jgi:hypothetical protein
MVVFVTLILLWVRIFVFAVFSVWSLFLVDYLFFDWISVIFVLKVTRDLHVVPGWNYFFKAK